MITPTAVSWLSASLILVTVFEVSFQRHAFVAADSEFQTAPATMSDLGGNVYRRRFMFGRRSAVDDLDSLWNGQVIRQAASRRRFKFGKKSDPSAAEKRKLLLFGKKWSHDYPAEEDKRMFKFGKRN